MNLDSPGISYALLIIPALFAFAVLGQGISKKMKGEEDGSIAMGFGVFLLVLICAAYWFFIR